MAALSIAGALLGAVTGIIPDVVGYFQKKEEYKYDLQLFELKMQAASQEMELRLDLEDIKADYREGESLRDHDSSLRGGKFMDALRASVRPVITYCFFALFAAVEISAIYFLVNNTDMNFVEIMESIWDDNTQAMFASILGFWFGSRIMEKYRRGSYTPPPVSPTGRGGSFTPIPRSKSNVPEQTMGYKQPYEEALEQQKKRDK